MSPFTLARRVPALDVSPPKCRDFALNWSLDDDTPDNVIALRVFYCVRFPSVAHRGRNEDGEVLIHSVYSKQRIPDGWAWKRESVPALVFEQIQQRIEREELCAPWT